MITERYVVTWTNGDRVAEIARARGMQDGDGSSFWDWIEVDEFASVVPVTTLKEARRHALAVLPDDVCGEVRIAREVFDHDEDEWRENAIWYAADPNDDFDENRPDYVPEMEA